MSDYNEYKKYLDRFTGSTARPYTPRWREVMEILHYVPFINLKDAENSIQKNVFKSLGFFHQNDLTETERKKVLLRMKKSLKEITDLIGDVIDEELKACEVLKVQMKNSSIHFKIHLNILKSRLQNYVEWAKHGYTLIRKNSNRIFTEYLLKIF